MAWPVLSSSHRSVTAPPFCGMGRCRTAPWTLSPVHGYAPAGGACGKVHCRTSGKLYLQNLAGHRGRATMARLQLGVCLFWLCIAEILVTANDAPVVQPRRLTIKVLDLEGNPTRAARVYKSSNPRHEVPVDQDGVATIDDPKSTQPTLTITVEPEAGDCVHLRASVPVPLPQDQVLEFRLIKGLPIGGLVLDEDERPIASALVTLTCPVKGTRPINVPYPAGQRTVSTDESGRWSMDGVPASPSWYLSVSHQDYVLPVENSQPPPSEQTDALAFRHRAILLRGLEVRGRVLD